VFNLKNLAERKQRPQKAHLKYVSCLDLVCLVAHKFQDLAFNFYGFSFFLSVVNFILNWSSDGREER